MNKYIEINERKIGQDYPPLVIAEIGINHNGCLKTAMEMVDAAKRAGVEVIKHQTHIPDEEMSPLAKKAIPGNSSYSIYDIMSRCALSEEDEIKLKEYVEKQNMIFISTPFSFAAVDRLEKMNVPAYKIGSGEMNNYEFVSYVASKNKPIILSTGMNDIQAIKKAVNCIRQYHNKFVLLHTTNLYPTPSNLVRLGALEELKKEFEGEIIGLSDHSLSNLACLAATAIGASVLERHFTDTKSRYGEDIVCSMDEQECRNLIKDSAEIALMRGGHKEACKEEKVTIEFAFSTLVAKHNLSIGHIIRKEDLKTQRPYLTGILASDIDKIIGKKLLRNVEAGQHLEFDWIE